MPPRFCIPLIRWFVLCVTLCTQAFGEFTYERLSQFQPPALRFTHLTAGADGCLYTVSQASSTDGQQIPGGQQIVQIDANARMKTVVVFGLVTDLTEATPWLVLGSDGSLYGCATKPSPTPHRIIYRLTPAQHIEEVADGDFVTPPVLGSDGALYGSKNSAGIWRLRTDGVFEIVPGSDVLLGNRFALNLVSDPNGVVYFSSLFNLWKIGADGQLSEVADFGTASPTNSTLGYWVDPYLVVGKSGTIYGRSNGGGPEDRGVIFKITSANGIEPIVAYGSAPGHINGFTGFFNLAEDSGGTLYQIGDSNSSDHDVFAIKSDGTVAIIGVIPRSAVLEDAAGPHFPVTGSDGQVYVALSYFDLSFYLGRNIIYKLSLEEGCTVAGQSPLSDFGGGSIRSAPVVGQDGSIWACAGLVVGPAPFARLVHLRPDGVFEERRIVGENALPGRNPSGLRSLPDGTVVGVATDNDLTTIFRSTADGSVRHVAACPGTGSAPVLFDDGSIVGSTSGASSYLYRVEPNDQQSLIGFNVVGSALRGSPAGHLVKGSDGFWYGLTGEVSGISDGTIYRVSPSFEAETVHDFNVSGSAKPPRSPGGSFIDGGDGSLYAVVMEGGANSAGGLIRYTPGGKAKLVTSFPHPINSTHLDPPEPPQLTLGNDGWFYGVGNYRKPTPTNPFAMGKGFAFRVSKNGGFQIMGRFSGNDGALLGENPGGALTEGADGSLYGVTSSGGKRGVGTIFRITRAGEVQHVASFTEKDGALPGSYPSTPLVRRGSVLYGACAGGGKFDSGTIFRIDQGGRLAVIEELTGTTGDARGIAPTCLAIGGDAHIYGTGGANTFRDVVSPSDIHGTIFRIRVTESSSPAEDLFELPATQIDVLANDGNDFDPTLAKVESFTQPAHGRVTLNANGTLSYKPGETFKGTDQFGYSTLSGTATVNIVDTQPPVVIELPMWSAKAGKNGTAVLPDLTRKAIVREPSGPVAIEQTPPPGTVLATGLHDVVYKFTDVAGNSTSMTITYVVDDRTPPVITARPADRTIYRQPGQDVICPNLMNELIVTDNVGIEDIYQSPQPGTLLPDGYSSIAISISDAANAVYSITSIRVVPIAEAVGKAGDFAPGFPETHRYQSFGLPAIASDGTIVFKATLVSASGGSKVAIFRREPGSFPVPVAVTGEAAGEIGVFTQFGEPLVNSAGTVIFKAKVKPPGGGLIESIWSAGSGGQPELIAQAGAPLPSAANNEAFRAFRDVALLDSGAVFVHATIDDGLKQSPPPRGLWLVENGTWKLLVRTGDALTVIESESAITDFSFGDVLPQGGGQTRSFNTSGNLALRLTLADERSVIARVSLSGGNVVVSLLVVAERKGDEWLSLGVPAINDNGDIAFRGTVIIEGGRRVEAIGLIPAYYYYPMVVATSVPQGPLPFGAVKLGDPIMTPSREVVSPLKIGNRWGLSGWDASDGKPVYVGSPDGSVTDRTGSASIQHFDSIAASYLGIISSCRIHALHRPQRRGMVQMSEDENGDGHNILLQAEGDLPPTAPDDGEIIKRIDFLTPVLGVGGQTRSINVSGQAVFRAKLSSGDTAIYLIEP